MDFEPIRHSSLTDHGYSIGQVAAMARLGLVFNGTRVDHVDGEVRSGVSFTFIADSPMGRANHMAGHEDFDTLRACIEDARTLPHEDFQSKYPSLGPY